RDDAELAWPLRRVLDFNESVWRDLFSSRALAPRETALPGKKARFNGELGLQSGLDLAAWRLRALAPAEPGTAASEDDDEDEDSISFPTGEGGPAELALSYQMGDL